MPPRNPFYALIGLDFIEDQLNAINGKLDQLLAGQTHGKELIMAEREEIDNLMQKVQANKDLGQSIDMAVKGLLGRVTSLSQELQDAIANAGSDVSPDIRAAADALEENNRAIADALPHITPFIMANTPAQK